MCVAIRGEMRKMGRVTGDDLILKASGSAPGRAVNLAVAVGDEVRFRLRSDSLGVVNGDTGRVVAITGQKLTVALADGRRVTVDPTGYKDMAGHCPLTHAYATTLAAAQGLTVDAPILMGSVRLRQEAATVGLSRGRGWTTIILDRSAVEEDIRSRRSDELARLPVTTNEVDEHLARAWSRSGQKVSVLDFFDTERVEEWVDGWTGALPAEALSLAGQPLAEVVSLTAVRDQRRVDAGALRLAQFGHRLEAQGRWIEREVEERELQRAVREEEERQRAVAAELASLKALVLDGRSVIRGDGNQISIEGIDQDQLTAINKHWPALSEVAIEQAAKQGRERAIREEEERQRALCTFIFSTASGPILIDLPPQQLSSRYVVRYALVAAAKNGIELNGVDLSGHDLSRLDFTNLKVMGGNFTGADLSDSNFTGADFRETTLIDANLSSANFTRAKLDGATLARSVAYLVPTAPPPKRTGLIATNIENLSIQYMRGTGAARVVAAAALADMMTDAEAALGGRHGQTIKIAGMDISKLELAHVIQRAIPWDLINKRSKIPTILDTLNMESVVNTLIYAADPVRNNITMDDAMTQPEPSRTVLVMWLELEERRRQMKEMMPRANKAKPQYLTEMYTVAREATDLSYENIKATGSLRTGLFIIQRETARAAEDLRRAVEYFATVCGAQFTGELRAAVVARQEERKHLVAPRPVQPGGGAGQDDGDDDDWGQ